MLQKQPSGGPVRWAACPVLADIVAKVPKGAGLISRQRTKQAAVTDQQGFKRATRIICEFYAWRRGPPHHYSIAAPTVGEFESHLAKRLLQQYRHEPDMPTALRDVRSRGQSGKHLLVLSFSGFDPKETFRWRRNSRLRAILGCLRAFHSLVESATIGEVRVSPHVARFAKAGRTPVVRL